MRRLTISSFATGLLGVFILAVLLFSWGQRDEAQATFFFADPLGTPTIFQVALDMDPATPIPAVETTPPGPVPVFGTFTVDVVVDEVDPGALMKVWGYNLLWDTTILDLTGIDTSISGTTMLPTCFEVIPLTLPVATAGNARHDCGVLAGGASGEGTIVRYTFTCIAAGQTFLDLNFQVNGFTHALGPLAVLNDGDGQVGCGASSPATAVDAAIVTETITGPTTLLINTIGLYTDTKSVTTTSASGVNVVIGTSIIPEADCTAYKDVGTDLDPIDSSLIDIVGITGSSSINTSFPNVPVADFDGSVPGISPAVITTLTPHGLDPAGDTVIISGTIGGLTGAADHDINHIHAITWIDDFTFSIPVTSFAALGPGGTMSRVIPTSITPLTSGGATPTVSFDLECSQTSFHDTVVLNEIFLDDPKLYGDEPTIAGPSPVANHSHPILATAVNSESTCDDRDDCSDPLIDNSVSHSTINGAVTPLTLAPGPAGPALRTAITGVADADITSVTVDASALSDTDNAVGGNPAPVGDQELKKNEPPVRIDIEKTITLQAGSLTPVIFELDTTVTTPLGCLTTALDANPAIVPFLTTGPQVVPLSYDISCSAAGSSPTFIKNWDFDEVLTPADVHITDPDGILGQNANHEDLDIPVIEPFEPAMNVDQSSTDDPAVTSDLPAPPFTCLTTLGCEQAFYDSMGPGDPFASVMYVDFPKTPPGYTITTSGFTDGSIVVGELLDTTTIVYEPFSGGTCGAPSSTAVTATVDLTEVTANPLPPALQPIVGSVNALVRYNAFISNFANSGAHLDIDIVVQDLGTSYRQWRIVNDGDLGADWGPTICSGQIDYDILGLATTAAGPPPTLVNIRSCDDPGLHTFTSTWTRDDTDGDNYTATEQLLCAAADVSVELNKDEIIGNDNPTGDFVDVGSPTTRTVDITVSGPPDTVLVVSLVGSVECDPRWVSPADPNPTALNGIQTSTFTVAPAGAGVIVATYQITCSPAGSYSLQIVANATSVDANEQPSALLNNQAENTVQVIVNTDNDGDGVLSPADNCPGIANANQHDADSDGEGNACDDNDDNDFIPILANAIPPVVVSAGPINDTVVFPAPGFIQPRDACSPGLATIDPDGPGGNPPFTIGPDLDALSPAELALWQEDNDDFVVEQPNPLLPGFPGVPNFALDIDGCADTDVSLTVDKEETYEVLVSTSTEKEVTIKVTNGNAAVGNITVNVLVLSRVGKCEVRILTEAGDLYSEFQTDELTLTPPIDGPGGTDDYADVPDTELDTLHSQASISTGPMAAGEVKTLIRNYTIHCFQPSDQLWWDSTPDGDLNFDTTFELQVDVLPDAPVVEEDQSDNVHKNFPLVTAFALADLKFELVTTEPTTVTIGTLTDVVGFTTLHNNGPFPTDVRVVGNWITPPGCALILGSGLITIPPGVDTRNIGGPFVIQQTGGVALPPSVTIVNPIDPGSSQVICIQPSFHTLETELTALPAWSIQTGGSPEIGDACQNATDDPDASAPTGDGIVNDGCPQHIVDPDLGNNSTVQSSTVAAIAQTSVLVDVAINAPATGNVSEDETFPVTKTFRQAITPFYNPFLPSGEDGVVSIPQAGFFPCGDGIDNGTDIVFDSTDPDCFQGALPGHSIFPIINESLVGPADCSVSFHVTNQFLSTIIGGSSGLSIFIEGVLVDPSTPAGWEASDVVFGAPGEEVSIEFQIEIDGLSIVGFPFSAPFATVIEEEWDKHCFTPSTHDFEMITTWAPSGLDDPHLEYSGGFQPDGFPEEIFAASDLKVVADFFNDLTDLGANNYLATFVPAKDAPETGNQCQNSVDNDGDGIVNDGCPVEGHQKEALHNNGPYGPTLATVTITATASPLCGFSYDVRGDEASVGGFTPPTIQPGDQVAAVGGGLIVEFPALLPVSTDVWFAELWRFNPDDSINGCLVTIVKTVVPVDEHIIDADGATFTKTVQVCLDTDGDGVHDGGDPCNGPDNCPTVANGPAEAGIPGVGNQTDSDNDGLGDACDPFPQRPPHDGLVKYVLAIGPAAINLSDTNGRYMWIIAEVGNNSGPPVNETVTVTMNIPEDVPDPGCTRTPDDSNAGNGLNEALVLPGQDTFTLLADEQKFLVWRLRYECHSPAVQQVITQTVTVTIDVAGDGDPTNDSKTVVKQVIID